MMFMRSTLDSATQSHWSISLL